MARFPEQFVLQVQQATDIVDLISQYVALKHRGREFIGLCPFHDDKKPSLNVSPTKQIFKCFACGAGGAAFNFLMLYDKMTFPEAVRALAERANIPLPEDQHTGSTEGGMGKADLVKVTTFAAEFFHGQLQSPAGAAALAYARGRSLTDESIERFGLGYAPDSWDSLLRAAARRGINDRQLVTAGLCVRRESSGCYDRFRNRLMFPIVDVAGRVIAFGGRALAQDERAKYLNSAESPLFDKSAQLFALNWSREAIVSSGSALVVEGYLDALIPLQAGVNNVVATLGTALTDRHVRVLSRYAGEVVLIFDADTAGAAATERALELLLAQQVQVRVATLPSGKDPCDYCLAEGAEAFGQMVAQAPDALQYAWDRRQQELASAGANLADRRRVTEDFLRLVVDSSTYRAIDELRRGQLAQHIGHMLNIAPADLQQLMRRLGRPGRARARVDESSAAPSEAPDAPEAPEAPAERNILEVLLNRPDLFDVAAERLDPADFTRNDYRVIAGVIWLLAGQGRAELENVMASESLVAHGALLADLTTSGEARGNYESTLDGAIASLLGQRSRQELKDLKATGYDTDEALRRIQQHLRSDPHRADRRPAIR